MEKHLKEKFYQIIGGKIKSLREDLNLTQSELAQKLNLSRTSIVNIEQGRQHPYIHSLWDITEIFNINLLQILPNENELKHGINFDNNVLKNSRSSDADLKILSNFLIKINKS